MARQREASSGRSLQFGLEFCLLHVTGRLNEQQPRARFRGLCYLCKKAVYIRQFMHYRESQCKVHASHEVCDPQGERRSQTGLDSIKKSRLCNAAFEPRQHLGLDVHGYYPARCPNEASQFDSEEAHTRSGFEYRHSFADERQHHFRRFQHKAP